MSAKQKSAITSFFQPKKAQVDNVASVSSSPPPSKRQRLENKPITAAAIVPTEKAEGNTPREKIEPDEAAVSTAIVAAASSDVHIEQTGWAPFDTMEPSWRRELVKEVRKPYFQKLLKFLEGEIKTQTIFPAAAEVFTAFNLCPLDSIKVVVIGQDPYHGPGQAHGLAFSVKRGVAVPPSLRNMIKEASEDPDVNIATPTPHGDLSCWAKQGVLMLNVCLTVRKAQANSHQRQGWEQFTDAVVQILSKKKNIVYLLWGLPAQTKCKTINKNQNTILATTHPSPLSAYRGFAGSRCFSQCNEALQKYGKEPIDWNII